MSFDTNEFRTVMGHFATGVTIITTHDSKANRRDEHKLRVATKCQGRLRTQ